MNASLIISPISVEQQQCVIQQSQEYISKAEELFNIKAKPVEICFDLKGKAAGMYRVTRRFCRNQRVIRYNAFIFSKFYEDNISTTVPHEVAHFISDVIYGLNNIKPHGKEWKNIMRAFNADASVTANYDLSGIPLRKQSLFAYQCDCREHQLTSIRHNKIINKQYRYFCKSCKQNLQEKLA